MFKEHDMNTLTLILGKFKENLEEKKRSNIRHSIIYSKIYNFRLHKKIIVT